MAFHDIRFPVAIGFGSSGGPVRETEIVRLSSGYEVRNVRLAQGLRRYNVGVGLKTLDDLHTVIAFFEARSGQMHGFRFRDPADHQSCMPSGTVAATDQSLGTGDGSTTTFQLQKTYGDGAGSVARAITKPVAGTVQVAVDGVTADAADYAVDTTTGVITFDAAPGAGLAVTAGFGFDTPVRFDTPHLDAAIEAFSSGRFVSIPLQEIRG